MFFIPEGNILKFYFSPHIFHDNGIFLIRNIRFNGKNLHKPFKAGISILELLGKINQRLNRLGNTLIYKRNVIKSVILTLPPGIHSAPAITTTTVINVVNAVSPA